MSALDFYPIGTYDDPSAPWNQCDPEPADVSVGINMVLVKDTVIQVFDFEVYDDGDGWPCYDTTNSDLVEGYSNSEYTPVQLMDMLRDIAEAQRRGETRKLDDPIGVIQACKGWKIDDIIIEHS